MVGHVFILDDQESFFAVSFIRVGTEVEVMVAGAEKVLSFFFNNYPGAELEESGYQRS